MDSVCNVQEAASSRAAAAIFVFDIAFVGGFPGV
jgi:hypothetical protein